MMSDFRKANVDIAEDGEDLVADQNHSSLTSAQIESNVNQKSAAVRQLLARGAVVDALRSVLDAPPTGNDAQSAKSTQLVMDVLMATKSSEVSSAVKMLDDTQLDTLMKYVYKCMAFPEHFNSGVLLGWHASCLEIGGLGSIVRVMTDRQTV